MARALSHVVDAKLDHEYRRPSNAALPEAPTAHNMSKNKEKEASSGAAARSGSRGRESRLLRIVGGAWRSRRLRFPPGLEIRPTPDRVRETLFNWLAPHIDGARCLDLFAGSGALGLEALSRGAREVVFIERNRVAAAAIRALLEDWAAVGGSVLAMEATRYLALEPRPFDVVFLDPPFASDSLPPALEALVRRPWLAPGARIYVEFAARAGPPAWPRGLEVLKEGNSGEVGYHLLRISVGGGANE